MKTIGPQLSVEPPTVARDKCQRCGGFLVSEFFVDLVQAAGAPPAYRCVQCGDLIDSVVLKNRVLGLRQWNVSSGQRGVKQIQL